MSKAAQPVETVVPAVSAEDIPPDWNLVSIGDITDTISKVNPKDNPSNKIQYIDISGIDNERYRIADTKTYIGKDAPSRARQLVQSGDIVFSTVRTYLKNFALVPPELDGQVASTGFCVLRASDPAYQKYLFYFIQFDRFLNELAKQQRGTSYPAVRDGDVRAQYIPVPPSEQAESIVAEIEKQFSRLDEAVASLKRVKANLKRYKAAVLKAAVEGKLTEEWRKQNPDVEPASKLLERILAERRTKWEEAELAKVKAKGKEPKNDKWKEKYKEPIPLQGSGSIDLPATWCDATIGQVVECLDSIRKPINKKERLSRVGEIPYYGANGQVGVIDDYLFDEPLVLVVEDETFVGRTQPFSYKISGKTWVNNHAHVLRPTEAIGLDYLNYSLMFYPFIPLTTGTTGRKKLTQKALMSAPYRLPPILEQEEISAAIEEKLSVAEKVEQELARSEAQLASMRRSVLADAFQGTLLGKEMRAA